MLRYECLSENVAFGQKRLPSYPEDKIVSMLPMAHMYGMMFELIYPLCGGSSIYYLGKTPTPALLLGAMAEVKPYLVITVPLVMEKIFKSKVAPVVNKPAMKVLCAIPGVNQLIFKKIRNTLLNAFGGNVREIVMGGAALNPDVEKWFKPAGHFTQSLCPAGGGVSQHQYIQTHLPIVFSKGYRGIHVIFEGKIVDSIPGSEADENQLGLLMAGGGKTNG